MSGRGCAPPRRLNIPWHTASRSWHLSFVAPSRIGKYDVEERVGEGAMGVVYRALDPVLKRRVAIKVMSDAFAQNDDLRERFLREAQAAGSLQHPNVITIYDFGEVDGHLYIAMEFVEGQDVAELLAHEVPLTILNKLDIAIGVLQGLSFAHRRGIIHRDIKPANIRVDSDGNARIMDFGVAHLQSSDMTRSGVMLGTPSYMAPEQIVGGEVGPQTDIFSVGAVLYELLTGTRPFSGGPLQAVMYRVLSENPAPLDTAAMGLPARLNDIVMRALAKEPAKRYASAVEMANDLLAVRSVLDADSTASGTLSLRATIESALDDRRTSEFHRVQRRRAAMTGVGVAAAAALMLVGWLLARRGPVPEHQVVSQTVAAPNVGQAPTTTSPAPTLEGAPKKEKNAVQSAAAAAGPVAPPPARPQPQPQTAASRTGRADTTAAVPRTQDKSAPPPVVNSPAVSPLPPVSQVPTAPKDTHTIAPQPLPPVTAPAPAAAPSNPSVDIAGVVEAYARAIESRDMAELRRVYATITAAQASAFEDFFSSTRALHAALAAKNIQVEGARATARLSGTYDFTNNTGRDQHQTVSFDAEFRREGGVWKLVVVR
ncbi:MAG TPA: serine/threonine-protein kinase [Gemmatimonadaceae bacterium]|nr:serine/threonine-protein kinase [Gemmatimonadaceae bacterium]